MHSEFRAGLGQYHRSTSPETENLESCQDTTKNKNSLQGESRSLSHSMPPDRRAASLPRTDNPCGILERIVQTVEDALYKKAGTAFRRYQIIGSVAALCKDPEKWAADEKNEQELKFRLKEFDDTSSLKPELEKIASAYASVPLLQRLFNKPGNAGDNRTNPAADAAADNNNTNADCAKLEYEDLLKELKMAFLQKSGLQRMIDRTFENVFPGFANAVKLDPRNRIKAFGTIYGTNDFEGKIVKIELDLKDFLSICTDDERNRVQQDLTDIIAKKFIDGPANIATNLLKFKTDRAKDFSRRAEGKNIFNPETNILYSAIGAAIKAIEERKLKKKDQDVIAPLGDKVIKTPAKMVKTALAQKARQAPDEKLTATCDQSISSPAKLVTPAEIQKFIRSEIEPAIAALASDTMTFDQELQVADNLFCAIESVRKRSVAESWSFDTDLVKRIVGERLGKGEKHISEFGFYRAASNYCNRIRARGNSPDELAFMQKLIADEIVPRSDSADGGLSILIDHYFRSVPQSVSEVQDEARSKKCDDDEIIASAAKKLQSRLRGLKNSLGKLEWEASKDLVIEKVEALPNHMEDDKEAILAAIK